MTQSAAAQRPRRAAEPAALRDAHGAGADQVGRREGADHVDGAAAGHRRRRGTASISPAAICTSSGPRLRTRSPHGPASRRRQVQRPSTRWDRRSSPSSRRLATDGSSRRTSRSCAALPATPRRRDSCRAATHTSSSSVPANGRCWSRTRTIAAVSGRRACGLARCSSTATSPARGAARARRSRSRRGVVSRVPSARPSTPRPPRCRSRARRPGNGGRLTPAELPLAASRCVLSRIPGRDPRGPVDCTGCPCARLAAGAAARRPARSTPTTWATGGPTS